MASEPLTPELKNIVKLQILRLFSGCLMIVTGSAILLLSLWFSIAWFICAVVFYKTGRKFNRALYDEAMRQLAEWVSEDSTIASASTDGLNFLRMSQGKPEAVDDRTPVTLTMANGSVIEVKYGLYRRIGYSRRIAYETRIFEGKLDYRNIQPVNTPDV